MIEHKKICNADIHTLCPEPQPYCDECSITVCAPDCPACLIDKVEAALKEKVITDFVCMGEAEPLEMRFVTTTDIQAVFAKIREE